MVSAFALFRAVRADKAVSTSKRVANKGAGHAGAQLVLGFIARQKGNDKRADIRREINTYGRPYRRRKHTRNTDTLA